VQRAQAHPDGQPETEVDRELRNKIPGESVTGRVAVRMSVAPAMRMKRSSSDSCSSNAKIGTRSTMPANWTGCQTVVRSFQRSRSGWDSSSGDWNTASLGAAAGGERWASRAETGGRLCGLVDSGKATRFISEA
jgi:hypothetical protein